jgi:hypothetical protein
LTAAHTAKFATVKVLKKNAAQFVNGTNATLKQTVHDLGKKLTLSDDELKGLGTQFTALHESYEKLGVTNASITHLQYSTKPAVRCGTYSRTICTGGRTICTSSGT